jgi:hypothetical protein
MKLIVVPAFTVIAVVALGIQAKAQAPCPELLQLRNAANQTWHRG